MRVGQLRHYVTVQSSSGTGATSRGKKSLRWFDLYEKIPAEIKTVQGREAEFLHMLAPTATSQITIRYQPCITEKSRIKFGTRVFNIGHINNVDERNRWLVMACSEEK